MNAIPQTAPSGMAPTEVDLPLEASLQIQDIERELQRLRQIFDAHGPTAIDVSGVATIDTAGVQLLLAIKREGDRRGLPIVFRGESPALAQALKVLGLDAAIFEVKPA
jgi:anti-sigma B factor antagonist